MRFQGLGNMAVSNAFGSNTFNIFVALVRLLVILKLVLGSTSDAEVSLGWRCAGGAVAGGLAARGRRHLRRAEGTDLWIVSGAGMRADLLPRLRRCVMIQRCPCCSKLDSIYSFSADHLRVRGWLNWQGRTSCG